MTTIQTIRYDFNKDRKLDTATLSKNADGISVSLQLAGGKPVSTDVGETYEKASMKMNSKGSLVVTTKDRGPSYETTKDLAIAYRKDTFVVAGIKTQSFANGEDAALDYNYLTGTMIVDGKKNKAPVVFEPIADFDFRK